MHSRHTQRKRASYPDGGAGAEHQDQDDDEIPKQEAAYRSTRVILPALSVLAWDGQTQRDGGWIHLPKQGKQVSHDGFLLSKLNMLKGMKVTENWLALSRVTTSLATHCDIHVSNHYRN